MLIFLYTFLDLIEQTLNVPDVTINLPHIEKKNYNTFKIPNFTMRTKQN